MRRARNTHKTIFFFFYCFLKKIVLPFGENMTPIDNNLYSTLGMFPVHHRHGHGSEQRHGERTISVESDRRAQSAHAVGRRRGTGRSSDRIASGDDFVWRVLVPVVVVVVVFARPAAASGQRAQRRRARPVRAGRPVPQRPTAATSRGHHVFGRVGLADGRRRGNKKKYDNYVTSHQCV